MLMSRWTSHKAALLPTHESCRQMAMIKVVINFPTRMTVESRWSQSLNQTEKWRRVRKSSNVILKWSMKMPSIRKEVMATKKLTTKKKMNKEMVRMKISLTKKKIIKRRRPTMILARSRPRMKPWKMMPAQMETRQSKRSKKLRQPLMRLSQRFQVRIWEKSPSAILYISCSQNSRRTQK